MNQVIRQKTVVQPGGRISIESPELPVGKTAEVIVIIADGQESGRAIDMLGAVPGGYGTAEEVVEYLRNQRGSWD